jgi:hypothetical protein
MTYFSAPDEFRWAFCVEGFDPFLEVVRLTQPAVAMAFQFDRDRQRRIFGVVQQFLGGPLCQRREGTEFIDQLVGGLLEFGIWHAFGRDAPIESLFCG